MEPCTSGEALRRLRRGAVPPDSRRRPQGVEGHRGRQLREGRPEFRRRFLRGVRGSLRLRCASLPARVQRSDGRRPRPFGPLSVGPAADDGRPAVVRPHRRPARTGPPRRLHHVARKLRTLGLPRRVLAIRRPVGRGGRGVLERGRAGRYRKPRRFLLRPYLRQEQGFGRVVHGGFLALCAPSLQDETARRPLLLGGHQQHAAARLYLAGGRGTEAGHECLVRQ